ncbi:hypothetical protein ACLBKU_11720 [Erythrobacter sp. NE805]|uniref:hypothetical protein n=1 Tax=Erythrobacter sp. NE805 TaxID=3389875 RepID=UPI00396B1787
MQTGLARWMQAGLLLAAACAFVPASGEQPTGGAAIRPLADTKVAPDGFFPTYLWTTDRGCTGQIGNGPLLDDFTNRWYSSHLKAAGEQSLINAARAAPQNVHLRFTWLRSFHRPIVVRIDEQPDGTATIEAKMLSGAGGYDPGKIAKRVSRDLTPSEWSAIKDRLGRGELQSEPAGHCDLGMDGAQWIVELVEDGRYAFFERWSPDGGAVRDTGLAMLALTGFELQPIY